MTDAALEAAILDAHDRDDLAALARLYFEGGQLLLERGQLDAACFLFTQSMVYAYDCGDEATARQAHAVLIRNGREE